MDLLRSKTRLAALCALALSLPASALPWAAPELRPYGARRALGGYRSARIHLHPSRARRAFRADPGAITLPHMSYYGGAVIGNVKLVAVYWGQKTPEDYFASADGQAFKTKSDAFYVDFVRSPIFDWLSEYGTNITAVSGAPGTHQSINRGTYLGGFVIKPSVATNSFAETEIIAELGRQIDAGHLPAHSADTLYQVHFPPKVSLVDGPDTSCQAYCAYHDSFKKDGNDTFFSAIPDHSPGSGCETCGESGDWFENMTASTSHEIVEAVTDPAVGAAGINVCGPAWCDPQTDDYGTPHAEIGDICEGVFAGDTTEAPFVGQSGTHWVVQREWSNKWNACIVNQADAFTLTLTPPSIAIHGPGTFDFTISSTTPQSGAAPATLSLRQLASGVSASLESTQLTTGGQTRLHLTVGSGAQPFSFGVFADTGAALAMAVGSLNFDDFATTPSIATLALKAGSSANFQIATAAGSGSAPQNLSIQLTGKPPGVSATAPTTLQTGQTVTVTVTAIAGAPSSTQPLTFAFSNGLRFKTLNVPLVLDGDDFTALDDAAAPVLVAAGSSTSFHIKTDTTHGSPQTLTFHPHQLPPGLSAVFDPPSIQSGGSTTVSLQAAGNAAPGPGSFGITVAGPATSAELALTTTIQPGGCSTAGGATLLLFGLALLALRLRRKRKAV